MNQNNSMEISSPILQDHPIFVFRQDTDAVQMSGLLATLGGETGLMKHLSIPLNENYETGNRKSTDRNNFIETPLFKVERNRNTNESVSNNQEKVNYFDFNCFLF